MESPDENEDLNTLTSLQRPPLKRAGVQARGGSEMRVLALSFSGRRNGNCYRIAQYCLGSFAEKGWETAISALSDLTIHPCGSCDYVCFRHKPCPRKDDYGSLIQSMDSATIVLEVCPCYGGHLPALYFAFSERKQAIGQLDPDVEDAISRKTHIIVIGNTSAGGDMALHEALYAYAGRSYFPEAILLSSREYGRRSIDGNLADEPEVLARLDSFVNRVVKRHLGSR